MGRVKRVGLSVAGRAGIIARDDRARAGPVWTVPRPARSSRSVTTATSAPSDPTTATAASPSPAGAARHRSPGGVLPVERVPGVPDLPGLGAARGRRRRGGRTAVPPPGQRWHRGRRARPKPAGRPLEAAAVGHGRTGRRSGPTPATHAGAMTDPRHAAAPEPATGLGGAAAVGDRAGEQWAGAAGAARPERPGRTPPQVRRRPRARGPCRQRRRSLAGGESFATRRASRGRGRASPWKRGVDRRAQEPTASSPVSSGRRPPERPSEPYVPTDVQRSRPVRGRRPPPPPADRDQHDGPSWEQPRRYEAYPTIKARAGMPGLPRVAVMAGALGIAALALFFLPAILAVGGGGGRSRQRVAGAQCGPRTVGPVADRPARADAPGLHHQVGRHAVEDREALRRHDRRLLAANKDKIKDPDKIAIGDEIIIPVPGPDEEPGGLGSDPAERAP